MPPQLRSIPEKQPPHGVMRLFRPAVAILFFWTNSHINKGVNIAVILQYGHGTGTGGYVKGIDYINPALRPVFEQLADAAWREVMSS